MTEREVILKAIELIQEEMMKPNPYKHGLCYWIAKKYTQESLFINDLLDKLEKLVPLRYKILALYKNCYFWFGHFRDDSQTAEQWYKPRLKLLNKVLKKYK